jgi:hypothetical protein
VEDIYEKNTEISGCIKTVYLVKFGYYQLFKRGCPWNKMMICYACFISPWWRD